MTLKNIDVMIEAVLPMISLRNAIGESVENYGSYDDRSLLISWLFNPVYRLREFIMIDHNNILILRIHDMVSGNITNQTIFLSKTGYVLNVVSRILIITSSTNSSSLKYVIFFCMINLTGIEKYK